MSLTSEKTKYEHVALDDKGVPIIVGTNMRVIEIVLEKDLRNRFGLTDNQLEILEAGRQNQV